MDDKLAILEQIMPKAMLRALTVEAIEATPPECIVDDLIAIHDFPFKVGRESRVAEINGRMEPIERPKREGDYRPVNDIYLLDRGELLNISREHFQIERRDEGFYLIDRGSVCGTKIDEVSVGGKNVGGESKLKDGDVIGVGAKGTPYFYRFISFVEYKVSKS